MSSAADANAASLIHASFVQQFSIFLHLAEVVPRRQNVEHDTKAQSMCKKHANQQNEQDVRPEARFVGSSDHIAELLRRADVANPETFIGRCNRSWPVC